MNISPFSFLRLYLPIVLLVLVGSAFYSNQAIEYELTQIRNQESAYIKLGAGALSNKIGFVSHDLMFLSRHTALRAAIEQPTQKNLAHLAEDFSIFSASLGHYDQIRWIDQHGMEKVRVDYLQGKAVVIPTEKLQNKGQRYYFSDTIKLKPNEVFVSPLDLNIEQNSIEVPYKPMLRIATPVSDRQGNKRGIVILNYFGNELLTAYSDATARIADHSMIINGEGYWLKSPNPNDEWGFMFKRPELSMKTRAPLAWEHISNAETGQLELEDGLWTWETTYPLKVTEKSSTGAVDAFTPSSGEVGARQYVWKSVAHFPKSSLNAIRHGLWLKVVWITGVLLILFALVIWQLVRSWKTLAAEKLKFSTVADFAYDWETWLDSNGRYLYCSPSCERITGRPAEAFMADPNLLLNICHPDDQARLKSHLQLHQASDPPCEFDFRIVLPDGKVRWLEHACQSVFGQAGEFLGRRASNRDISERQLSEEKVRYSEQRFQDVSNAAGEYLWEIDTKMRYTYVSNRSTNVKGYSPEELLGHTPMEFMHPDDIAGVGEIVNRAIADKAPFNLQHRDITKSGAIVWEEVNGTPIHDSQGNVIGLRGAGLNITERKLSELALQESHQKMHSLLNSMAEGAYGVDMNGNCTFVNRSFLRILGYGHADEIIGKHVHELIHHSHPDGTVYPASECKMYNAFLHGQEIHVSDEVFWNKNGIAIPVEYRSQPIISNGIMLGAVATFVDITNRKLAEDQIRNLAFYDALTLLPNRRLLYDRLTHAMAASKRSGHYCALMFLDLDNFKPLNDTYGHVVGDSLLVEVAHRINGCVREIDTVARFGGDEFVVMINELDVNKSESAVHAGIIAENIRLALAKPYLLKNKRLGNAESLVVHQCTSSVGVVLFIGHEQHPDDILKGADNAMYKAKELGRNQIYFSDTSH
ncbi:putative diguanylate cyclase YegE [Ferriphaselus amnicola]|uniref:Putative diguanylate cyclase YegE n=1 Tax=Ferriphaselus amnicola TaxID=1188319 RepID=A0A2Z6GFN9_9PROT|nr:PAS domain S-box protein [Ferriphaselus amnicola]BBE52202.1 putative diguanylate cyclase YegE [Ferriphaselus amnicola]